MALNIPSYPGFVTSQFYLKANTSTFQSPLSRVVQRRENSGGLWVATYTLPPMDRRTAGIWKSWFAKLSGMKNTFNAYDHEAKTTMGTGGGTPLVNGGSQTGSSLVTDGWSVSEKVLLAGDYFSVGSELKIVTEDVTSDGSGNATISFKPPLRDSPADDAAIVIGDNNNIPSCEMHLMSDDAPSFTTTVTGAYQSLTFSAMESIS